MGNKIKINSKTCKKCNLCIEVCPKIIYKQNGKEIPIVQNEDKCIECGHCLAICPVDAIEFKNFSQGKISGNIEKKALNIESFLASLRSVRKYKDKPVEEKIFNEILEIANYSPCASNWRNVSYMIISDRKKIDNLESMVINHFKSLLKLLNPLTRKVLPVFSKPLFGYLKKMIPTFNDLIEKHKNGQHPIFYNAPSIVILMAPKVNPMSKDNVDAQMHYLRLAAHAKGIGTCIIGYAISSHKYLEKELNIDKENQIFGVITIGYPKHDFVKMIFRNSPNIFLN